MQAFSYVLPPERIAQRPIHPPDRAKLLVINRVSGTLTEQTFSDLPNLLREGDLLVFNETKVIPARLIGQFEFSGATAEILLVKSQSPDKWLCLGKPLKKFKLGTGLIFEGGLRAQVLERVSEKEVVISFVSDEQSKSVAELIDQCGQMPIPPYIRAGRADERDKTDYQTIFAKDSGSIAAPTASLHFTPELIARLESAGIQVAKLLLHVGPASFLPLWLEGQSPQNLTTPGPELYLPDPKLLALTVTVRAGGGRVIAVGTTVVRAMESMVKFLGTTPQSNFNLNQLQETDLFIQPGHKFKALDGLITNFHQTRTTHLLLVEALLGANMLEQAYRFALEHDFRFLSYGDGMLVV